MILPSNHEDGSRPFGEVAIRLGYTTLEEVEEALRIQAELREKGRPHKLIGIIMHEAGFLSNEELIETLQEMKRHREGA